MKAKVPLHSLEHLVGFGDVTAFFLMDQYIISEAVGAHPLWETEISSLSAGIKLPQLFYGILIPRAHCDHVGRRVSKRFMGGKGKPR
jgi:hypothetical protein